MNKVIYSPLKINEITSIYIKHIINMLNQIHVSENMNTPITFGFELFYYLKKTIKLTIYFEQMLLEKNSLINDYSNPDVYIQDITNINNLNNCVVNIINKTLWTHSDIIINYSCVNSIISSIINDKTLKRTVVYIPPLFYDFNPFTSDRDINIITTGSFNIKKRSEFIDKMYKNNLPLLNINHSYSLESDLNLYKNTKILINIHVTDSHLTFEELRCLPALLCGVLVISEDSPMKEFIPYKDFIIWVPIGEIIEKTKEVLDNYKEYYNKIFINSNIGTVFKEMKTNSTKSLIHCLKQYDILYNNME